MYKLNKTKRIIQIHYNTSIGYSLYIGRGGPVIINSSSIIGNNITIGAGGVITKSIPNNATIIENYTKGINYNNPGRYIKNKWLDI